MISQKIFRISILFEVLLPKENQLIQELNLAIRTIFKFAFEIKSASRDFSYLDALNVL